MKRLLVAFILALIVVLILAYVIVKQQEPKDFSSAFDAVPTDVAFFVHSRDIKGLLDELNSESLIWQNLLRLKQDKFIRDYTKAMVFLLKNDKLLSIVEGNDVILAFRKQGKAEVDLLLIVSFKSTGQQNKFYNTLGKLFVASKKKPNKADYNRFAVYSFDSDIGTFYFTFYNGLFIISRSRLFFESALRQLTSSNNLRNSSDFIKIAKLVDVKSITNLYINYSTFWSFWSNVLSTYGLRKLSMLRNFANWSEFDVKISKDYLHLIGFTSTESLPSKFLNIFSDFEPGKLTVDKILPDKTFEFIDFTFSTDFSKSFYQRYTQYLKAADLYRDYQIRLQNIKSKLGNENVIINLLDVIGNEIAIANVKFNLASDQVSKFLIIKLKSKSQFKDLMEKVVNQYVKRYNISNFKFKAEYTVSEQLKTFIYKTPITDLFDVLIGHLAKLPEQKYYWFVDDYVIFTDDKDAMEKFIVSYYNDLLLIKRPSYIEFRQNITPKANITYYIHLPFTHKQYYTYLNSKTIKTIENNTKFFAGIENFSIQYAKSKESFITLAVLNYNPENVSRHLTIWRTGLSSNLRTKPFIFINHYTFEKEIFVGDESGGIYLIDKNGKILWRKQLPEPIMGDIYMIDFYQNGKYQLLFNTLNKIYIVDRNGNFVENYPINLPAEASASISVFDYGEKGNYRIFVPCSNNRVYLYTKYGKLNEGWLITKTLSPIQTPVQHFSYKGKDYIVFADNSHVYILNRRGETRIRVKKAFPKAVNSLFYFIPQDDKHPKALFVTTMASGKPVFIDLNGNVYTTNLPKTYSNSHYFVLSDLNGDGYYEFVYAEQDYIDIYSEKFALLANRKLSSEILYPIRTYVFSKNDIRIGVVTADKNIYLLNNKLEDVGNFPKPGNTQFTISKLVPEYFSVIVGKDKLLINYRF